MLSSLTIQNIVLIDRLTLDLADGLCALTGETGAGKSILLDALGLALGARADTGLIRHGEDQAAVTAIIEAGAVKDLAEVVEDLALGDIDDLILRRVITRDGRSRAFVNDQPVSVGTLKTIGQHLVEVHGQFETQGLLEPAAHASLLDSFGGLDKKRVKVAGAWDSWRQAETAKEQLEAEIARARAEEDYTRHALSELDELAPETGEELALADRRTQLMHREKVREGLSTAASDLAGDAGAGRAMATARRLLERIGDKLGSAVDKVLEPLDRAQSELDEAMAALDGLSADLNHDPRGLEEIEERLFSIRQLARKHNVGPDDLPVLRDRFAEKLSMIDDQSAHLDRAAREAAAARDAYISDAKNLSAGRESAASKLDKAVMKELEPLKLGKAVFTSELTQLDEAQWGPAGMERVRFAVATNPGQAPGPIDKIASGGELARFMLALKVALRRVNSVPTLIFDEVDSGIGGAVADAVGERLARLGEDVQVLVVTHSPQVAARAGHHWQISKAEQRGGLASTSITPLDNQARREEIARMLSGAEISDEARAAADKLLAPA
ncbi:MAG: DNA repair protein RecN [Alphaproteobacteria bacterium]|nr:DNA repair protein RecN [Alphaproteobacteria bacterium SS10]